MASSQHNDDVSQSTDTNAAGSTQTDNAEAGPSASASTSEGTHATQSDPSSAVEEFLGRIGIPDTEASLFAVTPLQWCPHLETVNPVPTEGLNTRAPCHHKDCGDPKENWVCLVCYDVYCGRLIQEHMLMHSLDTTHQMTLSYSDISVWCYPCDSYVHHEILFPAKRAAHISKFGVDIPGMK